MIKTLTTLSLVTLLSACSNSGYTTYTGCFLEESRHNVDKSYMVQMHCRDLVSKNKIECNIAKC